MYLFILVFNSQDPFLTSHVGQVVNQQAIRPSTLPFLNVDLKKNLNLDRRLPLSTRKWSILVGTS